MTTTLRWSKWPRSSKRQSMRALAEQTVEVEERALVRDDLDAAGDQRAVELLRPAGRAG